MEDYFLQRKYVNNTLGYLSADIICSALGKDNVRGQIYDRIFEPIGGYSVYYSSNIFRNRRGFLNWRVSFGYLPVLAGEYSGIYLTRLDQSRASENI